MQAVGLAFPAALHAAEVLPKSYSDVFALEQPELLALVDKCGLGRCPRVMLYVFPRRARRKPHAGPRISLPA